LQTRNHGKDSVATKIYDEIEGNTREVIEEREKNVRKGMEKQITSAILAQIYNSSNQLESGQCRRNENEIYEFIESNSLDDTLNKWTEEIRKEARETNIEIAEKQKNVRQVMDYTNQKKTIQLLTKNQTPQCEVEHELLKKFFDDR
jgi:BMFP domain-containing protein YqiC